jgi:hypothetical protein
MKWASPQKIETHRTGRSWRLRQCQDILAAKINRGRHPHDRIPVAAQRSFNHDCGRSAQHRTLPWASARFFTKASAAIG